ncbi:MAG: hypothetical protein ACK5JF_05015 [Oscillospiraceae bacterium]
MPHYKCPDCGASLDPGERCDCAAARPPVSVSNPQKTAVAHWPPKAAPRKDGKAYAQYAKRRYG